MATRKQKVLILIDLQYIFVGNTIEGPRLLKNIVKKIKTFRRQKNLIINITYNVKKSTAYKGICDDTNWSGVHRIIENNIKNYTNLFFTEKNTDCGGESLYKLFQSLNITPKTHTITIAGVNFTACVHKTTLYLKNKGFDILLPLSSVGESEVIMLDFVNDMYFNGDSNRFSAGKEAVQTYFEDYINNGIRLIK